MEGRGGCLFVRLQLRRSKDLRAIATFSAGNDDQAFIKASMNVLGDQIEEKM